MSAEKTDTRNTVESEIVILYDRIKKIESTVLVRRKMPAGCTGYFGVSCFIAGTAAVFGCVGTAVFCYVSIGLFICTHGITSILLLVKNVFTGIVFQKRRENIQMTAFQIENVKEFMQHLFQTDMFDRFYVGGCEVSTFVTFSIDGKKNRDWYDTGEEMEDGRRVSWRELKPVIYMLIKGKKTPGRLMIDLRHYLPDGDMGSFRIMFEKDVLTVYSGYMQQEFSMDREKQLLWDEKCENFLKKNDIVSTHV